MQHNAVQKESDYEDGEDDDEDGDEEEEQDGDDTRNQTPWKAPENSRFAALSDTEDDSDGECGSSSAIGGGNAVVSPPRTVESPSRKYKAAAELYRETAPGSPGTPKRSRKGADGGGSKGLGHRKGPPR